MGRAMDLVASVTQKTHTPNEFKRCLYHLQYISCIGEVHSHIILASVTVLIVLYSNCLSPSLPYYTVRSLRAGTLLYSSLNE